MSGRSPDATAAARVHEGSLAGFDGSSAEAPPSPSDMFVRLGMLLAIALCFGLAAHMLVGVPH